MVHMKQKEEFRTDCTPDCSRPLWGFRYCRNHNIKRNLTEIRYDDQDWVNPAQERERVNIMKIILNLQEQLSLRNFLNGLLTVTSSRRPLPVGVPQNIICSPIRIFHLPLCFRNVDTAAALLDCSAPYVSW